MITNGGRIGDPSLILLLSKDNIFNNIIKYMYVLLYTTITSILFLYMFKMFIKYHHIRILKWLFFYYTAAKLYALWNFWLFDFEMTFLQPILGKRWGEDRMKRNNRRDIGRRKGKDVINSR